MIRFLDYLRKDRRNIVTAFLSILTVTGIFSFISFVYPPSEADDQFILGLSFARFSLGVLFLVLVLANIAAAVLSAKKFWRWQENFEKRADALISSHIQKVFSALYGMVALTGAFLLLTIPPIATSLKFLEPFHYRLSALIGWLFLAGSLLIILLRSLYSEEIREENFLSRLDRALLSFGVLVVIFVLYEQIAYWIGWVNKSKYSYWDELAVQFIKGQLYLHNPAQTHDLTLYAGKWFVPNPPVPAILMVPIAFFVGAEKINTGDFSIFFSAINGLLLFLILGELIRRKWIKLTQFGALWLVALFAFGTPHLSVGLNGRMWFVSQILTVTFLALGILAALRSSSAWLAGICIGLAVGTRPNGLMSWPIMFAIAMQIIHEEQGSIGFKRMFTWALQSAIPIGMAIAGLLVYNYVRFEDFLDFGYTTINGDPGIVASAQTYGLFSPHFISYNLRVMFLYLPKIQWGSQWPILPSGAGMSLFLTTPALIYLFHIYERKAWIVGAWTAILLNFILLVHYHNAGKDQFGYRYILDVLVPISALLAAALGKRIPWHFVLLLLLSVAINIYGAYWFMNY